MKLLFLVNPHSGRGKAAKRANQAMKRALQLGHEVEEISLPNLEESHSQARRVLSSQDFDALIIAGGDGSVHDALPLLTEFNIPFAVIASGTGNDFTRVVGLHKRSPEAVIDLITSTRPESYDLGEVRLASSSKIFIQVLSTGFDSLVNERANGYKHLRGKIKYVLATLREIFIFQAKPFTFSVDGVRYQREAMLLAVANGANYGGGMKIVPHADGQDGKLDLLLLNRVPKGEFIRVFPRVFSGRHLTHPAVEVFAGREIEIAADVVAYADGEYVGDLPLSISTLPGRVHTWIAH